MSALRRFVWLLALIGFPGFSYSTPACPFCEGSNDKTLVNQFGEAQIVLFGHFENAKLSGGLDQGISDFVIERVYKDHDMIKGRKIIPLNRYVRDSKIKFIIFCDIYKGKIDAYKGTQLIDDSEMIRYVEGIMKLKEKSPSERLRFAFDFLSSPEIEVSMDAYREFARADYRDYKDMAKTLPADKIAAWLKDPKTSSSRYGLYASLLGHCGDAEDAKLLKSMIDHPEKRKSSGLHGLMASYAMLEPQKGWTFLKDLVQDKQQPFLVRYSGLQTIRFLYESRTDVVAKDEAAAKKEIINGVLGVLNVTDMADFAIEDLRKWKRWECCDRVIGLFGQKNHSAPVVRKSILRYALQCPSETAQRFVKEQRARDREWVDETRELLELETTPSAVSPVTK